ncbi:MAG: hypothetical protein DDT24_00874 [Chloroflexi bacterium]|nr:hypothetical protein [Chloroflexota bacterium]
MRCHQVRERLAEYLAGALRGNDTKAFEEHLQSCQDCADELASFSKLDARLRQEVPRYWESIKPAPGFLARLERMELDRSPGWASVIAGAFSGLWLRHRPALAVGLSVCLVVALALIIPRIVSPGVEPPIDREELPEQVQVQEKRAVPEAAAIPAPASPVGTEGRAGVAALDAPDHREQQVARAVDYLRAHFNPEVGLIHRRKAAVIVEQQHCRYDQIYWLYPDNLIASHALDPFDADMAHEIRETLQHYAQPPSRLFEVLFGKRIPEEIATARQAVIIRETEFPIMAEFHDSPPPLSWEDYGDMLIYQSLNQHLRGNREKARKYFDQAYSMWDGKGILDAEAREKNRYAGHNLALILYAGRVLNITINSQIEATLWGMQNPDGGIAAYADLDGNRPGTSDSKTTAMALLAYSEGLIDRTR